MKTDFLTPELIAYEEIFPVWRNHLWPERQDPIESMSAMTFPSGIDAGVMRLYKPSFFGIRHQGKLIAVNSGHLTSKFDYRSRGLYVDPEFRNQGLAQKLLDAAARQGASEGAILMWSYPRRSALFSYLNFGFLESDISPESETNCYVWKRIVR
ncbi:MAG: GNAT family N-acetyltransferase [Bdellovibrionaceae bacterium]|nr:GNAT family N-acetyltransferase [Pseudobdellovibrionaceae bacterium]